MREMKIDPRVIKHLGDDLITSSEVAVIELIKNSIDAKAENVSLNLYNDRTLEDLTEDSIIKHLVPKEYHDKPILIVEDDGIGMNNFQLSDGFLVVGSPIKEENDNSLGKKGIGRLATQRLGKSLLVETSSADDDANCTYYIFVDWGEVAEGNNNIPDDMGKKTPHHTRLWIFDVKPDDYLENAYQFEQLSFTETAPRAVLSEDLRAAIGFLESPFEDANRKVANISFSFNGQKLESEFPKIMLNVAESMHTFSFSNEKGDLKLEYGIDLKPWYAERVHRALAKAEAFKRLKKPHTFYKYLLESNADRLKAVLHFSIDMDELCGLLIETLADLYPVENRLDSLANEKRKSFIDNKAIEIIQNISKIQPVCGKIYSFKQGIAIGERISIESAKELGYIPQELTLKDVKAFLNNYNGVKLYRGDYRIGFLGNKENDWIKLQQYRTKGQQWYRFDLGNTVGQVSLQDSKQILIKETSSRLELIDNETAIAFKFLINIVFNSLFYDLNRKANDIVKVLLDENNLLGESLPSRVDKNKSTLRDMMARNKKVMKTVSLIKSELEKCIDLGDERVVLNTQNYQKIRNSVNEIAAEVKKDTVDQKTALSMLKETEELYEGLKTESYNNYKLMANGLITETITHELHSITTTGMIKNADDHFNSLKEYFVNTKMGSFYNKHVFPLRNGYLSLEHNLEKVGDLYAFLEPTFIKKGSYDAFVSQNIKKVVDGIKNNLIKKLVDYDIQLVCLTEEMEWIVPKGVLVHVFYNLINNSIYWIDKRREWAKKDIRYVNKQPDSIIIEPDDEDNIIVSDTGTGVLHSMEDVLFEALQSGKPLNEGRGMGLYIVKELLKSFGSDIILLDDRNAFNNRYKFMIKNAVVGNNK